MANILMPFLMSMLLGRTIDLRSYYIGTDMFDSEQYDEIPLNRVNTTYTVLQNNELPYYFMALPVDLALRIKSGILTSFSGNKGLNGLLTDTVWKQRSVTIVVATAVRTVKRILKKDAQPIKDWTSKISKSQTHYMNSLIYGGWSFIMYRLKCDIPGDVEIVRRILTEHLGVYGSLDAETITKWENAVDALRRNHEVRGKVGIHVHSYSSFPFNKNVSSISDLMNAVNEIPNLVGPKGKPLYMELTPLNELDASYPVVYENHTLDTELIAIDAMYDDVRNTKQSLNRWVEESDIIFSEEEETKIFKLLDHLSSCLKLFYIIASEASVYKNMDQKFLKTAVELYNSQLSNYENSYDRIFRRLKEEISAECQDKFLHKITGLLEVEDTERIQVGEVEGGLQECKEACLALPQCRSIGYIDQMLHLKKVRDGTRIHYKVVQKQKLCYVYLRSSSSADVVPPIGATSAGVYDRVCK